MFGQAIACGRGDPLISTSGIPGAAHELEYTCDNGVNSPPIGHGLCLAWNRQKHLNVSRKLKVNNTVFSHLNALLG